MSKIKIDINKFSKKFKVRKLLNSDVDEIYNLCKDNTFYYEHCPPFVSKDSILSDMVALPPNKTKEDKYYIGFFEEDNLIAIMDFINACPDLDCAFIGLFMLSSKEQGKGLGSYIIDELCDYLASIGFKRLRLAWVDTNYKAKNFWNKNNFKETGERNTFPLYEAVLAERLLK